MTTEYLTGIHRVLVLMDYAIERAIIEGAEFTFIDWNSRNHKGVTL